MASINLQGDTSGSISISAPSVAGSNTLTLPATTQTLATQNSLGVRNLIINGDMRIAQRGTSATISGASAYHTVDRFVMNIATTIFDSIATMGQNLDSLTPPSDFSDYVGIQINTGTALSGNPFYNFRQQIEGNNLSHLKFGTSDAKTITLSFWVRSTLTGDFSFSLRNGANNRSYVTTYNIASANTWEKKTITITGDTTGTWAVDNTVGLSLNWGLGNSSGSFSTSTLNEWQASSLTGATTGVDLVATTNAKWYITGVQLEVGTEATPFEHRPYDMELARCQRYLPVIGATDGAAYLALNAAATATTHGTATFEFPVQARTRPTGLELTASVGSYYLDDFSTGRACSAVSVLSSSNNGATIRGTTTGLTQYRPLYFWFSSGKILFTGCEL
jgi:hypothetical protein